MDMKELLGKKSKEADPLKKEAKLKALKELRAMATGMGGNDVKAGLEKVTVAAPDKDSLKMGLDKAKEVVDKSPTADFAHSEDDESPEAEASETPAEEASEMEDIVTEMDSPDEIDALVKKLEEKKKALLLHK